MHLVDSVAIQAAMISTLLIFKLTNMGCSYASGEDHMLIEAGVFTEDGAVRRT